MSNWQEYIVSDKGILSGKPTIKGTRISVELIVELTQSGWTNELILENYPHLKIEQIEAAHNYFKETTGE